MWFIQYTPYSAAGHLGRYVGMMSISPSHYENIDMISIDRGSMPKATSDYFQEREASDLSKEGKQTCKELDLTITMWFIFINVLYFLISELIFGASFCKAILGGKLYDYNGNRLTPAQILLRNILFCFILIISIILRFILNINYFITIILFFLLYDYSVFKSKQNLLDKISKCYLRNSLCLSNKSTKKEIIQSEPQSFKNDLCVNHNNMHANGDIINGKHKKNSNSSSPKNIILYLIYIALSLYSIQNILSYFFADYYNVSNYDIANNTYNEKESNNNLRKEYEKDERVWKEYPKELFAISRQLSHSNSQNYWGNSEYGPIPVGELISTYEGEGSASYIAGYKDVKYFHWEDVLPQNIEDVYEWMKTGKYKKKKVYYTLPKPYYRQYSYRNSISTFSIDGLSSIFANCEWFQTKYLNSIINELNVRGIVWSYKEIGNITAIAYDIKKNNDRKVRRVIACANGNAYLLETEASENLWEQSDLLCSSISFNHFQIMGGYRKIIISFCVLIFCTAIGILYFSYQKRRMEVKNRYSYTLFGVGVISIVMSFLLAIYQSYLLYTSLSASCSSVCLLVGYLLTNVLITTPLCVFYYWKSKEIWSPDYIIPPFIRRMHYNRIKSEINRKIYFIFLCIPLMVLSLLPLGIYIVIFYSVPMILIYSIILGFVKWQYWVKGSKMSQDSINKK